MRHSWPHWKVDQHVRNQEPSSPKRLQSLPCPGDCCKRKVKPNPGNRQCSNGRLCIECCDKQQSNGYSRCHYTQHNYKKDLEKVSQTFSVSCPSFTELRLSAEKRREVEHAPALVISHSRTCQEQRPIQLQRDYGSKLYLTLPSSIRNALHFYETRQYSQR